MKAIFDLLARGGPTMIAIVGLSVVLYTACFHLLLTLARQQRRLRAGPSGAGVSLPALRRLQQEIRETFRLQRIVLGAMIASAPLLGLLGTVNGMMKTFGSLSEQAGQKSMEGLAHGISEVLVATESGLAVALPAMLLVYLAHRAVHRQMQQLNALEAAVREGPQP
jgi:biopolymer transport protein ExbB/TolQ